MNTAFVVFKYLFTYSNSRTILLFIWGGPLLKTNNRIKWGKNSVRSDVLFDFGFFTSRMPDSTGLKWSAYLDHFNWFEMVLFTWVAAEEPYGPPR